VPTPNRLKTLGGPAHPVNPARMRMISGRLGSIIKRDHKKGLSRFLMVSVVSIWGIAITAGPGRIQAPDDLENGLEQRLTQNGFRNPALDGVSPRDSAPREHQELEATGKTNPQNDSLEPRGFVAAFLIG
jgi:hypothetical protein